jgi:hypothetical protein
LGGGYNLVTKIRIIEKRKYYEEDRIELGLSKGVGR